MFATNRRNVAKNPAHATPLFFIFTLREMNTVNKKPIPIHWHILGCIAFLIMPILLSPRPEHMPVFSMHTLRDVLSNLIMLVIFYLNYFLFIPKLYFKKRYTIYSIVALTGFIIVCLLPPFAIGFEPPPPPPGRPMHELMQAVEPLRKDASLLMKIQHNIFLYITVILTSLLLSVRTRLFETEILKQDAEIGSLKSRINPHFLFNTLNNIYALAIRERANATASSMLKLSGMMRYVVTETVQAFVALDKEIRYTTDYIELQKIRLTNSLNLSYSVTGDTSGKQIAPVLLMPFIENAFKHGVNPDQESYIRIHIVVENNTLTMQVENQKVSAGNDPEVKSGVGLENTKERLLLLYPKKHTLSIEDTEHEYRITLTLQLA